MTNDSEAKISALKRAVGDWAATHTQVISFGNDTLEVITSARDALDEPVYCFIEKHANGYRVTDDGRTLFKLDPDASDEELYETASELIDSKGFTFDQASGAITMIADAKGLAGAIMELTQLAVAITYLV